MTHADMGAAPLGKQAFRKAYNREIKRQADSETFGAKPLEGEVIAPVKRNQWNKIELTDELKEEIINRVGNGELLKKVCRDEHIPAYATINREIERDPEFGENIRAARRTAAAILVDEIIEIADDVQEDVKADGSANFENIARSKIKIETRKWVASKLDPARFSEKVQTDITSGGEKLESKEISPLESARQVAFALELAKRAGVAQGE
jgi:hypothetical protein